MLEKIRKHLSRPARRPHQLLQIESSLHCNLECIMCPWTEIHHQDKILTLETFDRIRPYFSQVEGVDLTGGGETLMNPHIPAMVQAARQAGCQVGFSTNGLMLSPALAAALVDRSLDWISFSVDAATSETYQKIRQGSDFETVLENMAALRDLKTRLGRNTPKMMMVFVMMTGDYQNYHELPAYLELAHSLGVEQVIVKNLDVITKDINFGRGVFTHRGTPLPSVEAIREQAREKSGELGIQLRLYELQPRQQVICEQNPVRNLYINWAGNVSPCITLSYAETRVFDGRQVHVPCQVFGNVNQEPLEVIWQKPEYVAFRRAYAERLKNEQEALIQAMLGGEEQVALPPAPEGCQTCYYLYGV